MSDRRADPRADGGGDPVTDDSAPSPSRTSLRLGAWRERLGPWLPVTLSVGVLSGMATFLAAHPEMLPDGVPAWWPTAVVVFAGAVIPVFIGSLSRSIRSALAGFAIGVGTLTVAWVAPWWVLPFVPSARKLLFLSRFGRVLVQAVSTLLLPYFTGYLTAVLVVGVLDP